MKRIGDSKDVVPQEGKRFAAGGEGTDEIEWARAEELPASWGRSAASGETEGNGKSVSMQLMDITYEISRIRSSLLPNAPSEPSPVLQLFGTDMAGQSMMVQVYGFLPYLYVNTPPGFVRSDCEAFREALESAARQEAKAKDRDFKHFVLDVEMVQRTSILFYAPEPSAYLKITLCSPTVVTTVRGILQKGLSVRNHGHRQYSSYESDLPFVLRFMIDRGIVGAGWVELPAGQYETLSPVGTTCVRSYAVLARHLVAHPAAGDWLKIAPLRVLSFDIECAAQKGTFPDPTVDPVIQIATIVTCQGNDTPLVRTVFTLNKCTPIVGADVLCFATERELLLAWSHLVRRTDPDLLTGYNIVNFDFPYLLDRAAHLKVDGFPTFSRLTRSAVRSKEASFSSQATGKRESKEITVLGRVVFDAFQVIQRDVKLRSYTLNAVSAHFLKEQKEDVHHSIITELQNGSNDDRRRLAVYCFAAEDHQLLTNKGFLGLEEFRRRWDREPDLLAAGYDPSSRTLRYERPLSLIDLPPKPLQPMISVEATDSHISLLMTPEHDMLVSSSMKLDSMNVDSLLVQDKIPRYQKMDAAAVAEGKLGETVHLLACAPNGLAPSSSGDPLDLPALGLRTPAQRRAFCRLYGYWVRSGSGSDATVRLSHSGPGGGRFVAHQLEALGMSSEAQAARSALPGSIIALGNVPWRIAFHFTSSSSSSTLLHGKSSSSNPPMEGGGGDWDHGEAHPGRPPKIRRKEGGEVEGKIKGKRMNRWASWVWAMEASLARAIVAGYAAAEGQERSGEELTAASASESDDLVRLALHGGYSAVGEARPEHGDWLVRVSCRDAERQPSMRVRETFRTSTSSGGSWCLQMPSGHVVVRRQQESGFSRPTIQGNCLKDSYLPLRLLDKLMSLINYIEMARVTGVPISYLLSRGQGIKVLSQMYRYANAEGMIIPYKERQGAPSSDKGFEGAVVIDPVTGFYTMPIATLDFASLYPSIMMAHNLCYSTLVHSSMAGRMMGEHVEITPSKDMFVKPEVRKGLLPRILEELLAARRQAKEDMKNEKDPFRRAVYDGRQLALKIVCNSVYGFTGAQVGKLPCLEISSSVTAYGREMIVRTRELVLQRFCKKNGYAQDAEVVYGDTDSVMVKFGVATVAEAMVLGREGAEFVTSHFPRPIKLEFEKVYCPYLLLQKKRYAGLYWTRPTAYDFMDTKGIESVRRDNCPLVKMVIDTCLHKILIDQDPDAAVSFVKGIISDLLQNKLDVSMLVISKALTKREDEYKGGKLAHVVLAERMRKRDAGSAPNVGDRIAYVIVQGSKGARASDHCEDPLYVLENNIPIDTQYYLENQLKGPVTRIFEPLMKNVEALLHGEHTRRVVIQTPSVGGLMGFAAKRVVCLGCKGALRDDEKAICRNCKPREAEIYQRFLFRVNQLEAEFSLAWTQCQRCQGSMHQKVLCTSRDCPIFYIRKKIQIDLEATHKTLLRFEQQDIIHDW